MVPERADGETATVVKALIFVIDPAVVTMFLNIQKYLKHARETAPPSRPQGSVFRSRTPTYGLNPRSVASLSAQCASATSPTSA